MVYYVHLSTSSSSKTYGTEGSGHVGFICGKVSIKMSDNNEVVTMPSHESFIIRMGEFIITVTLSEVVITKRGEYTDADSTWNAWMEFICGASDDDGSTIYLWVEEGFDTEAVDYLQWYDDDGDMKDYLRCKLKSFNFNIAAVKKYAKGTIQLEEVWS